MSLLRNLLQPRNAAKSPVPLGSGSLSAGRRSLSFNLGGGRDDAETAMRQYGLSGTIFGIVSLLAESAATPQWHLYKKTTDGRRRYSTADNGSDQRTEVLQHAAIQLWNTPNDTHSRFEFAEGSQQHQELTGETFWVFDIEAGFPTGMWYVRPDRMQPVADDYGTLTGWIYKGPNGDQVPLKASEVILEKRPNPLDPYRGAGPVSSILPNIQQQRYATEYQRNLFLNGADPGGVLTVPTSLSEEDFDQLIDRWRESHRGVARAGTVGVLEDGMTWTPNANTNKDMEYGQLRLANRDELREAWRIHKAMMGSSDDVNRANAQTAEEVFISWQIIPRLNRRRDTLNNKYLPMFGSSGQGVEFDYDDPSPENAENAAAELAAKTTAYATLVSAGVDRDDAAEVVGLPAMREAATPPPALDAPQPPSAGGLPTVGNRQNSSVTVYRPRAATPSPTVDLAAVDAQWKKAVAALVTAYTKTIIPAQRRQIVAQIEALIDAGTPEELISLQVDSDQGSEVIFNATTALATAAAARASHEAKQQGTTVTPRTPTQDDLQQSAKVTAALLAMALALSAGSEAYRRSGADPTVDGGDLADSIDAYLEGLSDASITSRLSGALSAAQNNARILTFLGGPAADLYASEVNDKATCTACSAVDGTFLGNTAEQGTADNVAALYPNGGYIDCAGADRCRGTVFADYTSGSGDLGADYADVTNKKPNTAEMTTLVQRVLSDGYMPVQKQMAGR